MITEYNYDKDLARLQERGRDFGYDVGEGYCLNCGVHLTEADVEAEECTNCGSALVSGESVDEHLFDED